MRTSLRISLNSAAFLSLSISPPVLWLVQEQVAKHLSNRTDNGWSKLQKCEGCAGGEEKRKQWLRWEEVEGEDSG